MELFGFELKRKLPTPEEITPSFAPKDVDDGAVVIAPSGATGTYVDLDGTIRSEAELVTKYREMSLHPECDSAVDEIINESISIDEETIVDINLDNINVLSPAIKKVVRQEFLNCLNIIEFNKYAYDIYRRWYIDGRLYYHTIIDEKNPSEGIKEMRYIDPRKIRKIREVAKKKIQIGTSASDATLSKTINEYYIYNDKGFNYGNKMSGPTSSGLKISKDSIVHVVSGVNDNQNTMVLSYLHKAIKALNQLRTLEDALVVYRLARAPERRIWYIDVGNLPKAKAEQYVRDIMVKHKNRLIYDASSGEIRDDRKFMTMLEDYWLPRREGGRGTEVTTLPGGQTLGQMDDVLYFQKKFLQCLNVPVSRLNSDSLFSIGRATEITRDELKFARFVVRLRSRFSLLFTKMLEKQLVLKGIMTLEEFNQISNLIKFNYSKDNYFTELKDAEITEARTNLARNFQDMAGKYYSHHWLRKNILKQSDDDIETMDMEIEEEAETMDPRWFNPMVEQNAQMMAMDAQQGLGTGPGALTGGGAPAKVGDDSDGGGGGGSPMDQGPELNSTQNSSNDKERMKLERIRQAQVIVDQMKKKKGNRSPQDQAKYKAAVQIVAKNKGVLSPQPIKPSKDVASKGK
jgi:hypothetical protein